MVAVTARAKRSFEVVPVGVICALAAESRLPRLPAAYDPSGFREATLAEASALTWALSWEGPAMVDGSFGNAVGVCAWRDSFDYTLGRDIREIVHIAGTKRSVVNMLHMLHLSARHDRRALVGHVASENAAMRAALGKLGARETCVLFEAK